MAITIRNKDTLKKLDVLLAKTDQRTKTGLIDHLVGRFPFLEAELRSAKKEIRSLETELYQIKRIVRNKARADEDYRKLCEQLDQGLNAQDERDTEPYDVLESLERRFGINQDAPE